MRDMGHPQERLEAPVCGDPQHLDVGYPYEGDLGCLELGCPCVGDLGCLDVGH